VLLIAAGFVLAGCGGPGERRLTTANDTMLVVVDAIVANGQQATATVYYEFAKPQSLSEEPGDKLVARAHYERVFDCSNNRWRATKTHLEFVGGGSFSAASPDGAWQSPAVDTVGGKVVRSVCDPAFAKETGTSRPLVSIVKDYRKKVGAD